MISIEHVCKTYGKKDASVEALKDITLNIPDSGMTAIMGPSGSGKSTLLNMIGCLDSPSSGSIKIDGKDISQVSVKEKANSWSIPFCLNKFFGFVMQDFALIPDYTVIQNIEVPLVYAGKKGKERKVLVENILSKVGLLEKRNTEVQYLSGGQKQRIAIARALVNDPKIILADEPTGALDLKTGQEVMNLFLKMKQMGKTVIIVTHSKEVAAQCDNVINIIDGKVDK